MNKIVFTARTVKGLSKEEIAQELGMSESTYEELELELTAMTPEMAEKLENFYCVPAEYFLVRGFDNIQVSIDALEKHKKIISNSDLPKDLSIPAHIHASIAKMGLEALIASQGQILLLLENKDLKLENKALRTLYNNIKTNK